MPTRDTRTARKFPRPLLVVVPRKIKPTIKFTTSEPHTHVMSNENKLPSKYEKTDTCVQCGAGAIMLFWRNAIAKKSPIARHRIREKMGRVYHTW